jgi:hypothetical protein
MQQTTKQQQAIQRPERPSIGANTPVFWELGVALF